MRRRRIRGAPGAREPLGAAALGALAALALLLCLGPAPAAALPDAELRLGRHGEKIRFVLAADAPLAWQVSTLGDPWRIVIDTELVDWHPGLPAEGLGFVSGLRYGRFSESRSRIVLDLSSPALPDAVFTLPGPASGGQRLVVDLAPAEAAAFPAPLTIAARSDPPLGRERPAPAAPPPPSGEGDWTVVIDAGHGGVDPGATAKSGLREKDIVLEYAVALEKKLLAAGGFRVHMTRRDDRFLALRERVALAERAGGDMFVSIHADAHPSPKLRGASVYTLSETASDEEAVRLAARENQADVLAGIDLAHHDSAVSQILIDLSQRDSINASRQYAELLVAELRRGPARTCARPPARQASPC